MTRQRWIGWPAHVYDELRRIARRYMGKERAGNTLQATALVNEVYLRLADVKDIDFEQRAAILCDRRANDAPDSCGCRAGPWHA